MARRRVGKAAKAQIWVAAVALIAGGGFVAFQLRPPTLPSRVAAVTVPSKIGNGVVLRDPLAIGPEAVMPEAIPPAPPRPVAQPSPAEPVVLPLPRPIAAAPALVVPPIAKPSAGEPAWRRFAVPAGSEDGRPMIAIVIDDVGLDRPHSDEASRLPGPLTLSFMTYADDLPAQTAAARAHGHEIMLHVPMEPQAAHIDPGPYALRASLGEDEIKRRFAWDLGRIDGIVGINNHMGSRFTESAEAMAPVLAMLRERGLFFLDSRTTPHSVGIGLAVELGLPHAARDIFLDVDPTDPAVAAELAKTEAVARHNGFAIAIGHPHEPTLTELRRWLPTAEARGFRLVPVSAIVRHNEGLSAHAQRAAGPG